MSRSLLVLKTDGVDWTFFDKCPRDLITLLTELTPPGIRVIYSVYNRHCLRHSGGGAAKEETKMKGESRELNPEAGFLSSLPMMHHTLLKKKKEDYGWMAGTLATGLQLMISGYEKCGPYSHRIEAKWRRRMGDIICVWEREGEDLTWGDVINGFILSNLACLEIH